jgi:phage-related tail fiber protein
VAGTLASSFENGDVVDGVTLVTGDRILVKNQGTGAENGIYVVKVSGAPDRAADANLSAEVTAGMFTFVSEGTTNGNTGWVLTTDDAITLDTTALTFTQFSGAGTYLAGDGLQLTGSTFSAKLDTASGLSKSANGLKIDTAVVVTKYATTITPVTPYSATEFTLSHNLGTTDIQVTVYEISSAMEVVTDVTYITTNTVTIGFAVAPASGETYRVVVHA